MKAFIAGLIIVLSWTALGIGTVVGLIYGGWWLFAVFFPPWVGWGLLGLISFVCAFGKIIADAIDGIHAIGQRALDKRAA